MLKFSNFRSEREYRKRSMRTPLFEEQFPSRIEKVSNGSRMKPNDFDGSLSVSFYGLSEIKFEGGGDGDGDEDQKEKDEEMVSKALKEKPSPPKRDYGDNLNLDKMKKMYLARQETINLQE